MIDHLVYATPDLAASVNELNFLLGITLSPGGQHVGLGTRNYLADLGGGAFLEVVGPDPDQPEPAQPRPFNVDTMPEPRLLTWAIGVRDLDDTVQVARGQNCDLGPIVAMARDREDGVRLSWRLAVPPDAPEFGGLVPFLLDWGESAHPSDSATPGLRLTSFIGFHPDIAKVRARLAVIGAGEHLSLREASTSGLLAILDTPAGVVELR